MKWKFEVEDVVEAAVKAEARQDDEAAGALTMQKRPHNSEILVSRSTSVLSSSWVLATAAAAGSAAESAASATDLASTLGSEGPGEAASLFRPTSGGLGGVWSHAWSKGTCTRVVPIAF